MNIICFNEKVEIILGIKKYDGMGYYIIVLDFKKSIF